MYWNLLNEKNSKLSKLKNNVNKIKIFFSKSSAS